MPYYAWPGYPNEDNSSPYNNVDDTTGTTTSVQRDFSPNQKALLIATNIADDGGLKSDYYGLPQNVMPPDYQEQYTTLRVPKGLAGLARNLGLAMIGAIAIPLLTIAGYAAYYNIPTKDLIVLVAEFRKSGSKQDDDNVTKEIIDDLREATAKLPVNIKPLGNPITFQSGKRDDEIAEREGG
jgi:hypothetical protein